MLKVNFSITAFFIAFILSIQFYILDSGLPQPSHFTTLLFVGLLTLNNKFQLQYNKNFTLLFLCGAYILFVNFTFAILNQSLEFIPPNFYIVYNLLTFLCFYTYFSNSNDFIKVFKFAILSSFILIILLHSLGMGRYNFAPRYNGFFNDPNQMAFWALSFLSIYLVLEKKILWSFVLTLIATYIIVLTLSRSALIGLLFVWTAIVLKFLINVKMINKVIASIIFFVVVVIIWNLNYLDDFSNIEQITIYSNRLSSTDAGSQLAIRGYNRFFEFPEYLFFGAGKGLDMRFYTGGEIHEIHSTWFGVWFYYGVFTLFLFLVFLYKIAIKLNLYQKLLFVAPMLYGFSTYSFRTNVFWLLLATFAYVAFYRKNDIRNRTQATINV